MLSVFVVSAVVHEYALAMGFGFFYPVMFFLFAVFGGEGQAHYPVNHFRFGINRNIAFWHSAALAAKKRIIT